jgi:Virulence factor BrkB
VKPASGDVAGRREVDHHADKAETPVSSGRVKVLQDWLTGRADTRFGRLALQWFRAYFAASRNSGCAATIYSALSVLPAALVAVAYFHSSGSDANAFSARLVTHLRLTGPTASLVQNTFGSASANRLAATVTVVISFLLWGIAIGQIYQDVYARAWRIKVGSVADQALFAIFFFVLTGAIALTVVSAGELRAAGWLVLLPVWLIGSTVFWLWVPRFLLHRKIGLRALLPGALLATVVVGGTTATAPLFVSATLNANGKAFGSFGVVATLIGYVFVVITMSLVCAVFSPVWAGWRESERQGRNAADAGAGAKAMT